MPAIIAARADQALWIGADGLVSDSTRSRHPAEERLWRCPVTNYYLAGVGMGGEVQGANALATAFRNAFREHEPALAIEQFRRDVTDIWQQRLPKLHSGPASVTHAVILCEMIVAGGGGGQLNLWRLWFAMAREKRTVVVNSALHALDPYCVIGNVDRVLGALERRPDLLAEPTLRQMSGLLLGLTETERSVRPPFTLIRIAGDGRARSWVFDEGQCTAPAQPPRPKTAPKPYYGHGKLAQEVQQRQA